MEKIIEVKNLRKKYGKLEAVKGIDIDVFKGEIFGFLGPNGAGKTTTLEILEGLRKPTAGTIKMFGREIKGDVIPKIKERIGVVLQQTSFLDHLKVKEILELFASFFKKSIPIEKALEMVELQEKVNAYPENLSGGQRQRLAIAVALINDPDLIFMDEPTTGLDPQSRESIWVLIEKLKSNGKTIFLTTHYMEEAQRLCDRITIIDHGKVVETGSPEQLILKYGGESKIDFSCTPTPPMEKIKELENELQGEIQKLDDHCRIVTSDLTKTLEKIVLWSKNNNVSLTNVFLIEPTLEDVFLNLTGRELRD
ncbi:ABC transporter ATP-binding protein [Mesoaciditoga lauensis]|uniref:ABC transporter ATP-binding protein n=1 Tax=Mesoaciditoga lauensis TaxID=1495039 RepID=UPI000561773C|nr:ABC transporter ATP-binding protein [Mesoaciditoga lauensis]